MDFGIAFAFTLFRRAKVIFLSLVFFLFVAISAEAGTKTEALQIVALGDSLTAGYGLPADKGFVPTLERALRARGHNVRVLNAGVSGDSSSGGLSRLDWAVGESVDGVILELGANDALRGINPALTKKNLDAILTRLGARDVGVLLAGMRAPPNLGEDYVRRFDSLYGALAKKHEVALYPFFLEGVAGNASLNLADGIHPNEKGIDVIVASILPHVENLLQEIAE